MSAMKHYWLLFFCPAVVALGLGSGCNNEGYIEDILLVELPPAHLPFKSALLPVEVVAGAQGVPANAARDQNGDLLVAGYDTDRIFSVDRRDGSLRSVASGVTGGTANLLSVAYADGFVYAGTSNGKIYAVDSAGVSTELVVLDPAESVNGLAIAPSDFPAHGGALVAVTSESAVGPGAVHAVDLADPSQIDTLFSSANAALVDLVFGEGGALYVVDYAGRRVVSIVAGGATDVAGGFGEPVGIGRDPSSGLLFVADAGSDTLHEVDPAGGATRTLGRFDFRPGVHPSGVVFDGVRNLLLMTEGSSVARGVILPGFNTSRMPTSIPFADLGFGGLTFDGAGALFGTANGATNGVYRIDRHSGWGSVLTRGFGVRGEALLGIEYDAERTQLFIGTDRDRIVMIDRNGYRYQVADFSGTGYGAVYDVALAPANYGAWGGALIAVTSGGQVIAVDPETGSDTLIGENPSAALSAIVFAADGTLYAAHHGGGSVVTVDPGNGALTDIETGLGAPDGLAIHPLGTTLFVTDSLGDKLWSVTIPGGGATELGAYDFAAGPEPSGIVFDGLGELLLATGESSITVERLQIFP